MEEHVFYQKFAHVLQDGLEGTVKQVRYSIVKLTLLLYAL